MLDPTGIAYGAAAAVFAWIALLTWQRRAHNPTVALSLMVVMLGLGLSSVADAVAVACANPMTAAIASLAILPGGRYSDRRLRVSGDWHRLAAMGAAARVHRVAPGRTGADHGGRGHEPLALVGLRRGGRRGDDGVDRVGVRPRLLVAYRGTGVRRRPAPPMRAERGRCRGPDDCLTLSGVVAAYPVSGTTMDNLFPAVDDSMYEAKNAGRNFVRLLQR